MSKILRGFSSLGNSRAALISGEQGIGKSFLLEETGNLLLKGEPDYLWIAPQSVEELSPAGWCAQLARGIRAGASIPNNRLNVFAMQMGKSFAILPHTYNETELFGKESQEKVIGVLIERLEELIKDLKLENCCPVFALDDFDKYSEPLLD